MARKFRSHVPGGLYHVILRGNARQDIFFAPEDRRSRTSPTFAKARRRHLYTISQA
jgi:REP element-mobilizing transposase RayT